MRASWVCCGLINASWLPISASFVPRFRFERPEQSAQHAKKETHNFGRQGGMKSITSLWWQQNYYNSFDCLHLLNFSYFILPQVQLLLQGILLLFIICFTGRFCIQSWALKPPFLLQKPVTDYCIQLLANIAMSFKFTTPSPLRSSGILPGPAKPAFLSEILSCQSSLYGQRIA